MSKIKTKEDFQEEITDFYGKGYVVNSSSGGVRGTMNITHECGYSWDTSPRVINSKKKYLENIL